MRRSFGVGLGAEPTFRLSPTSGRKNQFADAGAAIIADSSRTVASVVFFIVLSCELDPFGRPQTRSKARHHAEATPKETREKGARVPEGSVPAEFTIVNSAGTKRLGLSRAIGTAKILGA